VVRLSRGLELHLLTLRRRDVQAYVEEGRKGLVGVFVVNADAVEEYCMVKKVVRAAACGTVAMLPAAHCTLRIRRRMTWSPPFATRSSSPACCASWRRWQPRQRCDAVPFSLQRECGGRDGRCGDGVVQVQSQHHVKQALFISDPFTVENGEAHHVVGDATKVVLDRKVRRSPRCLTRRFPLMTSPL
jgi:hypothetical protein